MKTLLIFEIPHKTKAVTALAKPELTGTFYTWPCQGHPENLPQNILGVNAEGEFVVE
jgi:hypothetical protein